MTRAASSFLLAGWKFTVRASIIGLALLLGLILMLTLYVSYIHLDSKFNLYAINNSLPEADELCVISSYSVFKRDGNSYAKLGHGREIALGRDIGNSDDGLFIAVLLKNEDLIKALSVIRTDAKILATDLHGCRKL